MPRRIQATFTVYSCTSKRTANTVADILAAAKLPLARKPMVKSITVERHTVSVAVGTELADRKLLAALVKIDEAMLKIIRTCADVRSHAVKPSAPAWRDRTLVQPLTRAAS